jgi:hypothetical protein
MSESHNPMALGRVHTAFGKDDETLVGKPHTAASEAGD